MKLDLHVHSNASDGAWAAEKVVRAAAAGGLDVLAVADHDTVGAVAAAVQAANETTLRVLPAIELTCIADAAEMHLLGYGVDIQHADLRGHAGVVAAHREVRMRSMIERLEELGAVVDFEDVRRVAGEDAVLGRPHLARALVNAGHVSTISGAFDQFLGDAGPAWVGIRAVSAADAIALVHAAGGVAVWAHPRCDLLDKVLHGLIDAGLDGLEVFRPRSSASEIDYTRARARAHGLLVTGGSDWHGPWSGRLGDFCVRAEDVRPFLERIDYA